MTSRYERFGWTRPHGKCREIAREFREVVDQSNTERPIQLFLEGNPWIIGEQFAHGHFVVPQFGFGGKYRADFVALDMSSAGTFVHLIELESPKAQLVTKAGSFGAKLRRGLEQVRDWRRYLINHPRIASDPYERGGLDLGDVAGFYPMVIAGRRDFVTPRFNDLRNQEHAESFVEIVTYDRILDWLDRRAAHWDEYDSRSLIRD
ncbi:Shedu immune nuclease family protein [Marinicauda sp. Alg238-R41]|uniref:Shedu immune nuclease family protein n=1 Tax=Marinicauda sp. Alg238-R41 TaxID=2993447 RepID=UPI0022E85217|nr:Shedu immune nuclease family protein [Marinicauda sp. Alg238-R41]